MATTYDADGNPIYDWSIIDLSPSGLTEGNTPALTEDPNSMGPQLPTPSYDGYTTGQWADPSSPAYDPTGGDIPFDWSDLGGSLKRLWSGLDDRTKARLIGGGLAGIDALTGSKLTGSGPSHSFAAIPKMTATRTALPQRTNGRYLSDVTYAAHGGMMPGGIAEFARGGRYLQGSTDGMADKLDTSIDGHQPAKLSHGEFVIPADVVSHLGNGNSDAGAKKLYQMMARIRKARTGNAKQGKQINPDKFMPGGLAALAEGGEVKGFSGATGSAVGLPAGATGMQTGPSDWAAPYVVDMLGKTMAATNAPYQAYQGPLTAGPSALQAQVSQGLSGIQTPANYGKSFTDAGVAQRYMNPYLQMSLNPQLDELRRQSGITQVGNDAKMTQAGAFGGDRQALLTGETQRNLQQQQALTTGNAYNTAFTNAMNQFNAEQGQGQNLMATKSAAGAVDQGLAQKAIDAEKTAFEQERDNPYQMLKFQQSMLQGLPISATDYTVAQPTVIDQLAGGAYGGDALWKAIFNSNAKPA